MFGSAPRFVRGFAYALTAGLALHVAHSQVGLSFGLSTAVFDDWIYNAVLIGSALVCIARAVLVREERWAWASIGSGVLLWCSADLYYTLVLAKLDRPPFPSLSDVGWLWFYPASWFGIVLLMRRRTREFHASLWLDGLVAALGVGALVGTLVLPPILDASAQGEFADIAVNLAYPVCDVLLLALLIGALALTGWRPDRPITLLGIGVLLSATADTSYLYAVAQGQVDGPPWAASLWPASAIAIASAAWQPVGAPRPVRLEGQRLLVLPLTVTAAALGLLFADHFTRISDLGAGLAFATLLAAGARLWLTLSEHMALLGSSRKEATTDPLTGLRNRRALVSDLDELALEASPDTPLLLLLFDLNGFKTYNDTYGHPAGDALLRRLGNALARAADGEARAYRMGGDEFCVLSTAPERHHLELQRRFREALSESGDGFEITAALGTARIDTPEGDKTRALRDADQRMYAEKNGRRTSAGGQSTAVLLRVLTERNPDLGDHVDAVVTLTERVAEELDMDDEDRTALWQAAALHDIGKAAVPDAILCKPGPLTADEWDFIRKHTLIGERILDGAPALTAAARIVRSSHEHFDGNGYPDQLAGEDIPLGARIVAVCDAYDAMVADRPYRRPRTPQESVDELNRCAGTQFDPAVVQAFNRAMANLLPDQDPSREHARSAS